jgi:hypothetical protein
MQSLSPAGLGLAQTNQSRWSPGAGLAGKRETITLTASVFTALSPPTGAKLLMLILGSATSLSLKSVTGDAGIPIAPSSNPTGIDLIMPLGASPNVGILNGLASDQQIEAIWG